jgi:hypothetical protein
MVKLRSKGLTRHVASVVYKRTAYRVLMRKFEGKNYKNNLCVDERIILKWKTDIEERVVWIYLTQNRYQ